MTSLHAPTWPVVTRYDQDHLAHIALPLGGIGTGTVSLGGRGDLRDWEIVNRPAKGFTPQHTFFALRAQVDDGRSAPVTRLLEGPLDANAYEGSSGATARNHGLPRFRQCTFEAAYPLGQVVLSDPDVPLRVRLQAFNPLIPGDADRSGLPIAVLRFVLTNPGTTAVTASICGNMQNFIGHDGKHGQPQRNMNTFREHTDVCGVMLSSNGVAPDAEQWGMMALCTPPTPGVSYRTAWANRSWGDSLLDFWDDFAGDGRVDERDADGVDAPVASLAVPITVDAGETQQVTFLFAWHFPNRQSWTPHGEAQWEGSAGIVGPPTIGNYYTTHYADAWDVAVRTMPQVAQLERNTITFVQAFVDSDLPHAVKEAALFNLSTLRTQTCFRTLDGFFFGWEGCHDHDGSCYGSCTHVWNYEQATAFLFGDLARAMRTIEFRHATTDDGLMSFRVNLPLPYAQTIRVAAADGQLGCLMKLYRDWQLSGDDAFLRALWPQARRALEFCWIPGGWDADRDGVMEGCQHNTMDVEYYGPNPQMGVWYLGALRAAEAMARHLGEVEFAVTCHGLFMRGSQWIDTHLFNGEYYEHDIRPPRTEAAVAPGLRWWMGATNLDDPELQLGAGCLVDQLVGQYMAHVCGLGYLVAPEHVRTTLASIMRYNFRADLHDHFNHMRSFALGDEAALLMATYPKGRRPERPFPYYNEVMTGFEYTAAIGMLYEDQVDNGLRCISAIRARYDGRKRNPFNEAECGHHYARAMASWAAVVALSGFQYSAVDQAITFAACAQPQAVFWSNGSAWGTCRRVPDADGFAVEVRVLHGTLTVQHLTITRVGTHTFDTTQSTHQGQALNVVLPWQVDARIDAG